MAPSGRCSALERNSDAYVSKTLAKGWRFPWPALDVQPGSNCHELTSGHG